MPSDSKRVNRHHNFGIVRRVDRKLPPSQYVKECFRRFETSYRRGWEKSLDDVMDFCRSGRHELPKWALDELTKRAKKGIGRHASFEQRFLQRTRDALCFLGVKELVRSGRTWAEAYEELGEWLKHWTVIDKSSFSQPLGGDAVKKAYLRAKKRFDAGRLFHPDGSINFE